MIEKMKEIVFLLEKLEESYMNNTFDILQIKVILRVIGDYHLLECNILDKDKGDKDNFDKEISNIVDILNDYEKMSAIEFVHIFNIIPRLKQYIPVQDNIKDILTTGLKYDTNKLDWSLMPFEIIEKIVEILQYGEKKYGRNNWQGLDNFNNRYFSALMRHLIAWQQGEKNDYESGLSHLAHAACNIIFLLYFQENKNDNNIK